jgi:hypothetical protein
MARKRNRRPDIEWAGGIYPIPQEYVPQYVGQAQRGELLMWMQIGAGRIAQKACEPGCAVNASASHFWAATKMPAAGAPHVPGRVRIADATLAQRLQSEFGTAVEVVHSATPELDALVASLWQQEAHQFALTRTDTYLAPGIETSLVATFFEASRQLLQSALWTIDECKLWPIGITAAAYDLHDAVIMVVDSVDEGRGYLLFETYSDYEQYVELKYGSRKFFGTLLPKFWSHLFVPANEMDPAKCAQVVSHGWSMLDHSAYPQGLSVTFDEHENPSRSELEILTAVSAALTAFVESEPRLASPWQDESPIERPMAMQSIQDPELRVEFMLSAPHHGECNGYDHDRAAITARARLLQQFAASPMGIALADEDGWVDMFLAAVAEHFDGSVWLLDDQIINVTLFEVIPAAISCSPDDADAIVTNVEAFIRFLQTSNRHVIEPSCMFAMQQPNIVARLRQALADTKKYNPAKAMFMAATQAGGDQTNQSGIHPWRVHSQSDGQNFERQLPWSALGDVVSPQIQVRSSRDDKQVGKERAKRKMAKASRRKNR